MKAKSCVLVIEDDESIGKMLVLSLEQEGYKPLLARTKQEALRLLNTHLPEIILLDLGLPDGDGKEVIKVVRKSLTTPIIVISARKEEKEIIASLDIGADDYVTKPFPTKELLARIRTTQRRFLRLTPQSDTHICDEITLDVLAHTASKNGQLLKLTPTEFNLLQYFILRPNRVLTHKQILKEVWGVGYQNEMQYLRTYINALRKKIESDTTRPRYIHTEASIGYRFACLDNEIKETHS